MGIMRLLSPLRSNAALAALLWACVALPSSGAGPSVSVTSLPLAGSAVAADSGGNIYLTGIAGEALPVTAGVVQPQPGGGSFGSCQIEIFPLGLQPTNCSDAFVAKIQPSTGTVVYATYLGGDTNDIASSIAVDSAGNVYVTGITGGDFPTTSGALAPQGSGGVFVTKLSPGATQLIYSTYIPSTVGSSPITEPGYPQGPLPAIAIDSQGNAYVTGQTLNQHAFAAKISADGAKLLYFRILAGSETETGAAIAVDSAGNAYLTGLTASPDFPVTPGAVQARLDAANAQNAFVAKLDASGNVVFATYLGGSGADHGIAIQTDPAGNVYVSGGTTSLDFPTTPGSYQPAAVVPLWAIVPGGFAAKLSPDGKTLLYSSYIAGGNSYDNGNLAVTSMLLDSSGGAYMAGLSGAGLAVTPSAPQPCIAGDYTVAVTHLNSQGVLVDRTYFGIGEDSLIGLISAKNNSVALAALENYSRPVLAQLDFGGSTSAAPSCLANSVANAASFIGFISNGGGIAPGEAISLSGFGLGPQQGIPFQVAADGSLPVELGGVQVLFDGTPAPLLYVQSQQINAFAPFTLAGQSTTTVQVIYQGETIGSLTAPVVPANPGIFRLHPGSSTQAAAINQDGTINGAAHPAAVGSYVTIFGTGFGQTQLPGVSGTLFSETASLLVAKAEVYVGGLYCPPGAALCGGGFPANVTYGGAAPLQFAGLDQINFQVPALAGQTGSAVEVNVLCTIGASNSSDGIFGAVPVTIAVQ